MTDDYDFRASERRRARELDELEARRLRARERQRAQLRAARTVVGALRGARRVLHRRRRGQRRVGVDERHAEGTGGPIVPVQIAKPAKPAVRTRPRSRPTSPATLSVTRPARRSTAIRVTMSSRAMLATTRSTALTATTSFTAAPATTR